MADATRYTYRVVWSEEDEEFVGTVAEFPSLSWLEEDQADALSGITNLVSEILVDMDKSGETPPLPLSERSFSGKFMVRTSPTVHRRLVLEAQEQGVSLNMLINQKISDAGSEVVQKLPETDWFAVHAATAAALNSALKNVGPLSGEALVDVHRAVNVAATSVVVASDLPNIEVGTLYLPDVGDYVVTGFRRPDSAAH